MTKTNQPPGFPGRFKWGKFCFMGDYGVFKVPRLVVTH